MQAASVAAQSPTIRPAPRSLSAAPSTIHHACRPISRKTVFSSRNAIIRQLRRSAIRDCGDWIRWRLVAEQQSGHHDREHTGRVDLLGEHERGERHHQGDARVEHRVRTRWTRTLATTRNRPSPTSTPPPAAITKSRPTSNASRPVPAATARAVRRATSAVASLSSDSPSRMVVMRRGRPIRRPIAVAATASGGATTAPIASASAHDRSGSRSLTTTATPTAVNTTRPIDSSRIGRRLLLKSTSDVFSAAAYRSGGSSPKSTTSSDR